MQTKTTNTTTKSVIAAVLHDVLHTDSFDTLADLLDALKYRCAQLAIPWTNDSLNEALRLVGSNVVLPPYPVTRDHRVERAEPPPDLPRVDAAQQLAAIRARLKLRTSPIKTMPRVELVSAREADRRTALEMVLRELQDTAARCDALEQEPPDDAA